MAPALQPPSRTATPTPIDALLAPLHLGSPPPSPSPATPSSPSAAAGLRSRKSTTALYAVPTATGCTSGLFLFGTDNSAPPPSDSSNTTALGIATSVNGGAAGWHSPRRGLQTADVHGNGKGKGRAVEQQRHAATLPLQEREREVIVHKVLKTDSIASISLKYGITATLRASNRLWPSDPLFLRSELLIPLDQCHLPSLSQHDVDLAQARRRRHHELAGKDGDGDEDGDLMGWDAAAAAAASGNSARRSRSGSRAEGEPPPATGTSQQRRGELLMDLSGQTTPDLTPTESTARESSEFLTIWDDDDDHNPHGKVLTPDIISGSLQDGGGSLTTSTTTIANPFEIATGLHLDGSTTSSLSSAAAPTSGVPSLLRKEVEASVADGAGTGASGGGNLGREQPMSPSSARLFRNNNSTLTTPPISPLRRSSEYNGSSVRSPSPSPSPSPSSSTPRTTLRIKRLPASELAFFPAPSHSTSSPPSSLSRPRQGGTTRSDEDEGDDHDPDSTSSSSSLFFRPLAKQLEQMSIPVPSFLVSSPSSAARRSGVPSSSSSAAGKGNGSGRIRLPPSPNLAPSRPPTTLSRKDSSSLWRTGAGGGGGGGWNLLDFGAEEDEANQLAAVQLRQMQHASSPPPPPPSPREVAMRAGPPGSSKSGFGSSHSSAHRHHHGNAESL
ncbi:hypothetical protein RHOSPDRAFT_35212 [Rhodotorula sp. JG-1b]|nr:hypothetical protein RHOSPDRAFT_35212 [Rhodotorula sp. JG-1b]